MHLSRFSRFTITLASALGVCAIGPITLFAQAPLASISSQQRPGASAAEALFESRIRPLLVAKCYACHSSISGDAKGGLKLDSREAMVSKGPASAVIPGDPDHSPLIRAVTYTDVSLKMPPAGKLKQSEIDALRAWVKSGAVWPVVHNSTGNTPDRHTPITSFWAFKALRSVTPPAATGRYQSWPATPLDRFILAGLNSKSLKPARSADRRTLLRRACFDLTGLPPSPQMLREFLQDTHKDAYSRIIDRLLASPAYGEKWGRHWLDVARYADSNGVDENLVYANAWRYRDYVIRSMNQNKPIDKFIQEQIAGDLLPPSSDDSATLDQIIATGYLSLGPKMLAEDDPVKQEEDIIDEQIDTLGKTFMGVTMGCARCHDHKFDPFPQTDYYALAGIFKSTHTMLNFKNMAEWQERPLGSAADQEKLKLLQKQLDAKRSELDKVKMSAVASILTIARGSQPQYRLAALSYIGAGPVPPAPHAVLTAEKSPLPTGAILAEAEDFVVGNVLKDTAGFGKGIGVLVNKGEYPNFTEYDIELPSANPAQLDLRYASGDLRPIRLYINGALASSNAAGAVTGGFYPDSQKWESEGVFQFKAGKNRVRLERDSYFPHIDKLLVMPRPDYKIVPTLEMLANEHNLVPALLIQAVDQLKKSPAAAVLEFTAPDNPDALFAENDKKDVSRLNDEIAALEKAKPVMPRAMAVTDGTPVDMKVHLRGNYLTLGQNAPRSFPAILTSGKQPSIPKDHSGRLELANWLTAPDNALTARVFVNRVWRWHFGTGIVSTPDNFGRLGERPSNQPLLDWLAIGFIKDGWSLKNLHRRIMLSNTYKMSTQYDPSAAAIDPENRQHWRFDRRRLEAEEVRDSILFVSGQLDQTIGGSLLKFRDREYVTSTANADPVNYTSTRRSCYLPVVRSALYDVYTAFDFGDPTVMNGDRATTTVSPQALFMMNSTLALSQTKAMAEMLLKRSELDSGARVALAYETCFGRLPTVKETQRAIAFVADIQATLASKPLTQDGKSIELMSWQSLCKSLVSANEFIYVD